MRLEFMKASGEEVPEELFRPIHEPSAEKLY
jgi:hypothetical protein